MLDGEELCHRQRQHPKMVRLDAPVWGAHNTHATHTPRDDSNSSSSSSGGGSGGIMRCPRVHMCV
jgi:hypothetical protein